MTAASSDSSAIPFMAQGLLVWIQHSVRKRGVHSDSSAIVTGLGLHGKDRNTGYGSSALARSVGCQCGSPSAGAVSAAAWSSSPAGVVAVASGSFVSAGCASAVCGGLTAVGFWSSSKAVNSRCRIFNSVCNTATTKGPTTMPIGPSACTPPRTLNSASSGCSCD